VLLPVSLLRLSLLLLHLPCNAQTNASKSPPTNNGNPTHHVLGASPQPKTNNKTKWPETYAGEDCSMSWRRLKVDCTTCTICSVVATSAPPLPRRGC
jgi:hypothetical protein